MVEMQDFWGGAAESYDRAFEVYEKLPEEERPWRVTWYQTGPLFAYYYMGGGITTSTTWQKRQLTNRQSQLFLNPGCGWVGLS